MKIDSSIFESRRCVHIKIPREVHATIKEKITSYNVTMQDLFQEYAIEIAENHEKIEKAMQKISNRKMLNSLISESKAMRGKRRTRSLMLSDLDSNMLYSLLEETEKNGHEDD